MSELPFRQIHLDFHTSPLIPDVAVDFNAEEFAETLKNAHVNSINIFAKCHHGMSYYPSKVGPVHPSLKKDLLGEMIAALHRRDIQCPIYTTVVWDEYAAFNHPEWLQIDSHGKVVGREPYSSEPVQWKYLCVNTGYADYLEAQIRELLDNYEVDGIWADIVIYSGDGCSCSRCIKDMLRKGMDPSDIEHRREHVHEVLKNFMARFYTLIKEKKPDALVYFNSRQRIEAKPEWSFKRELPYFTHLEIESLPSGSWGYNHFPMFVRYNQTLGKEIIGMNGKFHETWGDFGGFKNRAALEYECFSMLAGGAKVCIGDQLHPRGKLEKATYELIGPVFSAIEKKEPWCSGSIPVANIGLMTVNDGGYGRACRPSVKTLEAAMQLLLEDHQQFQIIDSESDFEKYDLIIFPDKVRFNRNLQIKTQQYLDAGGKILLSHESGLKEDEDVFAFDLGVDYQGDSDFSATYLRMDDRLRKGFPDTDYVIYEKGKKIIARECETLAKVVEPYFDRSWNHFMSHQQTAPDKVSQYAAVVRKNGIIYLANPIFNTYKKHGNLIFKKVVSNCIELLMVDRMIRSNLPSTARVTLLDQKHQDRRVVHILHYPIERRAEIDIIEDIIPLFNVDMTVKVPAEVQTVQLVPQLENVEFDQADGSVRFKVPCVSGHQMISIEFSAAERKRSKDI